MELLNIYQKFNDTRIQFPYNIRKNGAIWVIVNSNNKKKILKTSYTNAEFRHFLWFTLYVTRDKERKSLDKKNGNLIEYFFYSSRWLTVPRDEAAEYSHRPRVSARVCDDITSELRVRKTLLWGSERTTTRFPGTSLLNWFIQRRTNLTKPVRYTKIKLLAIAILLNFKQHEFLINSYFQCDFQN